MKPSYRPHCILTIVEVAIVRLAASNGDQRPDLCFRLEEAICVPRIDRPARPRSLFVDCPKDRPQRR